MSKTERNKYDAFRSPDRYFEYEERERYEDPSDLRIFYDDHMQVLNSKQSPKDNDDDPYEGYEHGNTHLSGISFMLSRALGHDKPGKLKQPVARVQKKAEPSKIMDPDVVLYGDIDKFAEKFAEIQPEKQGIDIFRLHDEPPERIIDQYRAHNKRSALNKAWTKTREKLGFEGIQRYPWEIVNDMSLAQIIAAQFEDEDTISLPQASHIESEILKVFSQKMISPAYVEMHKEQLAKAQARIDDLSLETMRRKAAMLSHNDVSAIRNWGQEIDLARVESLKALKDNTIKTALHTDNKVGSANNELAQLLRAKPPQGLSAVFFSAKKAMGFYTKKPSPIEMDLGAEVQVTDYRALNDEQRKALEEKFVESLEAAMRETMEREEERIVYAEGAYEFAEKYQNLLRQYRTELAKNRNRILTEVRSGQDYKTQSAENVVVSADKVKKVEQAIDDRLEALDESIEICNREKLHYDALAALHHEHKRNLRTAVNHSLERLREFERKEQQVLLTQNIALAGQYAQNLEGLALEKQIKIVTERLRDARAEEIERLGAAKKAMDTDEILVLDHQKPIALIEHQKTISLPAPSPEEYAKEQIDHDLLPD